MLWLVAACAVTVALAFMRLGALLVWMKVLTATVYAMAVAFAVLSGTLLGMRVWKRYRH